MVLVSFPRRRRDQQNATVNDSAPAPWYLGIDLGTGGLKVGAVGLDGTVIASAFRSIETRITDDGGNEQDPDDWFVALTSAGREVSAQLVVGGGPGRRLAGIGITGQ